ncbi:hypothetical protein [Robbsia andropogonis]|uniref:hypothetical protein n=1 Tax=Robbsia andropogonis TaxID=28092 RepID=UPI000466A2D4|nr:hypothetical protein [Robbsia andropogonis]
MTTIPKIAYPPSLDPNSPEAWRLMSDAEKRDHEQCEIRERMICYEYAVRAAYDALHRAGEIDPQQAALAIASAATKARLQIWKSK